MSRILGDIVITSYLGSSQECQKVRLTWHLEQRRRLADLFPNLRVVSICSGYDRNQRRSLSDFDCFHLEKRTLKHVKHNIVLKELYSKDRPSAVLLLDDDVLPVTNDVLPTTKSVQEKRKLRNNKDILGHTVGTDASLLNKVIVEVFASRGSFSLSELCNRCSEGTGINKRGRIFSHFKNLQERELLVECPGGWTLVENYEKKAIEVLERRHKDRLNAGFCSIDSVSVVNKFLHNPLSMPCSCVFFSCKGLKGDSFNLSAAADRSRKGVDLAEYREISYSSAIGWAIAVRNDLEVLHRSDICVGPAGDVSNDVTFMVSCVNQRKQVLKHLRAFFWSMQKDVYSVHTESVSRSDIISETKIRLSRTFPHLFSNGEYDIRKARDWMTKKYPGPILENRKVSRSHVKAN